MESKHQINGLHVSMHFETEVDKFISWFTLKWGWKIRSPEISRILVRVAFVGKDCQNPSSTLWSNQNLLGLTWPLLYFQQLDLDTENPVTYRDSYYQLRYNALFAQNIRKSFRQPCNLLLLSPSWDCGWRIITWLSVIVPHLHFKISRTTTLQKKLFSAISIACLIPHGRLPRNLLRLCCPSKHRRAPMETHQVRSRISPRLPHSPHFQKGGMLGFWPLSVTLPSSQR